MATRGFVGAPHTPIDLAFEFVAGAEATLEVNRVRGCKGTAVGRSYASLGNYATADFIGVGEYMEVVAGVTIKPTPVELRLRSAFPFPALEECRLLTLRSVARSYDVALLARIVMTLAHSTELRTVFRDPAPVPVSGKRKTVDIDVDLRVLEMKYPQVFRELQALPELHTYRELLQTHLSSTSFNHRVSAMCALLALVAGVLT